MSQTRTFKQSRKAIEPERTKQSQREPDRARESHREPDRATESHSWSQLSFDNNEEENVDGAGDRERVGRGRGCLFYLWIFSLLWNMTFQNENFHCSGMLTVEDSPSPLFYFCIPVQFQPSIWISAVASLPPPSAHSEILTVNWPGTPTLPCPTSYSRRKKATMMKMISMMMIADINWAKKRDSWLFFWTSVDHSLRIILMIMMILMVIIIITFAKPLMTGTYNDYLRHVASCHQTHFRS